MCILLHVHLVCSLFHVVCVYLVAAIDSIVHSLAFECIGVALFVESGSSGIPCV